MFSKTILLLICICATLSEVEPFDFENNDSLGVFGKLKSGLKLAGKLLGFDTASEVAKLVTESFAKTSNRNKGDTGGSSNSGTNIFTGFFRLLGLESNKIGAIAVNTLVFLAQLISSSLSRPAPSELIHARKIRAGTPLDWLSSNPSIKSVLEAAHDPELPENLIENIKERTTDEQTGCIQLLICKASPLLLGMQKAISKTKKDTPEETKSEQSRASRMYKHLPSLEEIADNGDTCEEKFPTCYLD